MTAEDQILYQLGLLEGSMKGICREIKDLKSSQQREIGELKGMMQCKTADCNNCRAELEEKDTSTNARIDGLASEVNTIKTQHAGDDRVQTWRDAVFNKTTGIIVVSIAVLEIVIRLWPK